MGVVSADLFPDHVEDLAMILECPERAETEPGEPVSEAFDFD
jgi:hypothetical protein